MVARIEYDVHTDTWQKHGATPQPPAVPSGAQLWKQAVAAVADKAKAALPHSHERIDSAVAIVLAGEVQLVDAERGRVASQSNDGTTYGTCNGTCECRDFAMNAPDGWCQHRLAVAIQRRALVAARQQAQALDSGQWAVKSGQQEAIPTAHEPLAPAHCPLPEAPASANVHVKIGGRMVQITLRDSDEDRLMARMERMMARYPVEEAAREATQTPKETPQGWCQPHQVQMTWNDPKPGDTRPGWWSHRLEDGSFCRGTRRQRQG